MSGRKTSRIAKLFAIGIVATVLVAFLPDAAFAAGSRRTVAPTFGGGSVPTGFINPGSTFHNSATFAGGQGEVDGTATFYLCGPKQPRNDSNVFPQGCAEGGTQVGDPVHVTRGTATSASYTDKTRNGYSAMYCWRVEFTPATGSPYEAGRFTNSTSQCVIAVLQVTIVTLSVPTGAGVAPGASVYDTATITNDVMDPPGKDVDFFLCSPSEVVVGVGCPAGGTHIGTDKLSGGEAVSPRTNDTSEPGTYCWRVEYAGGFSPPDSIAPGEHTNWTTECFTVGPKRSPTMVTVSDPTGGNVAPGTAVIDTATLTGTAGTPTGEVDFFLCGPDEVTAAGCPQGGTPVGSDDLDDGVAVSPQVPAANEAGTYCWRGEYSGDDTYAEVSHTNATTECFEVLVTLPRGPSTTTTLSSPTGTQAIPIGNLPVVIFDTATVVGNGAIPTGAVEFFLCGPGQGTLATEAGCPAGGTQVGGPVSLSVAGVATSASVALTTSGTYCWRAEYGGDAAYLPSAHTNGTTECFSFTTVRGAPPIKPNRTLPKTGTNGPTGFGLGIAFLAVGLVLISISRREAAPEVAVAEAAGLRVRRDRGIVHWVDRHRRPRRSTGPPGRAGPDGVHA